MLAFLRFKSLLLKKLINLVVFILHWLLSNLKKLTYGYIRLRKKANVLYKSSNYVIVDKPYDLKINSNDPKDTISLHYQLFKKFPNLADKTLKHYFYFVNRLDYSTSGLICIATNKKACADASKAFQKRSAKKYYLALVRGHVSQTKLNISQPVGELLEDDGCGKMGSLSEGTALTKIRKASTKMLILEKGLFACYPATKVLLMPETGRRHQLRVHCSFIGHTIVGDYTYSNRKDITPDRMYLHSYRLEVPIEHEPLIVETADPFLPSDIMTGWYPVEHIHPLNRITLHVISQQDFQPS